MMWLMILMLPLALLINTKPTLRAPRAMAAAD
jgi:hypothetical protein